MPIAPNRAYTEVCCRIGSLLHVSGASARRQVEIRAAREGVRDQSGRQAMAEAMLAELQTAGADRVASTALERALEETDDSLANES
ncbi:MAG: hypothetical protein ERJ67_09525 [Aphanocapsa feldmannii 277cV]|uniref:Uncharacterized protein n=2 Tax=Aphanocapsa feldmannii TaxID=192050 RepID=A0A524RLH7_9CHRO|nr:MAG: hypothetical protein ERJ69_04450 [Aphanocapsa feldmannii 288cV]TGG90929.1 MAG: hypothetical protein ERJ67_09525 [Aphanocapsa feldmannii 277cV]TGH19866.1 MAG: hypothetical protein ERJ68_07790 [Aphanocapsa feldmannii 277cI]